MSSSLLDQSDLAANAERLVAAARRAGADQADALAVRAVSLSVDVRDGAVEESQRSEGDDLGLRVLVGHRQAVVSTNDLRADGFDRVGRTRRRDGARRAGGPFRRARRCGACWRTSSPTLDLLDPDMPASALSKARPRSGSKPGLRSPASPNPAARRPRPAIGGMVLVTSHGFRGATICARGTASR